MKTKTLRLNPLYAAVALAIAAPLAHAAPAANTLPGQTFYTNQATGVSYSLSSASATINVPTGATVLQWGGSTSAVVGTTINGTATGTVTTAPGFNIGSGAKLNLQAAATNANVLISDQTNQASQIFGTLTSSGAAPATVIIANPNGVVVGSSGAINVGGPVGLLGYNVDPTVFAATGTAVVPTSATGTGAVSVANGASFTGSVIVAGNTVNLGTSGVANAIAGQALNIASTGALTIAGSMAGASSSAINLQGGSAATAAVDFSSVTLNAAGNLNVTGYATLGSFAAASGTVINASYVGGTLTNNGSATIGTVTTSTAMGGLVNNGKLTASTGGFNITVGAGGLINNATMAGNSAASTLAAVSSANVVNNGVIQDVGDLTLGNGAATVTNNGTINFAAAGNSLTVSAGNVNLFGSLQVASSASSNTNTLGAVNVSAASNGAVKIGAGNIWAGASSTLSGGAVRLVSGQFNVTSGDLTVNIGSGSVANGPYNLGLFDGTKMSATGTLTVGGSTSGSNVMLGGVLSAPTIGVNADNVGIYGTNGPKGFAGLSGGTLSLNVGGTVANTGAPNTTTINYKKGIPVDAAGGNVTIATTLANAGNAAQFINLSVNGNPTFTGGTSPLNVGGAFGALQANYPLNALTVTATGNITFGTSSGYYFPGKILAANVTSSGFSAMGNPASFALSPTNTISVNGLLSNVMPTVVSGNGGLVLLTSQPISFGTGAQVLTNTNSWVNFANTTNLAGGYAALNNNFYAAVNNGGTFLSTQLMPVGTTNVFNSVALPN